jgi:hypothetical protein
MTIQVEVSPELEASLKAEAALSGMDLKDYAGKLLEERRPHSSTGTLTPERFDEMLKVLTKGSKNLPILPIEVNQRSSYYEGR